MRIAVKVKPNSKEEKVEKSASGEFVLRVKAPAKEGKANIAVVKLLGEYFKVPKSCIVIVSGHGGRNKLVDILSKAI
jgi:hypothetical protein